MCLSRGRHGYMADINEDRHGWILIYDYFTDMSICIVDLCI